MASPGGAQPRPVMVFGADFSRKYAGSVQEPPRNSQEPRFLFSHEPMKEQHDGVSTELTLFTDPWTIKKVIKQSDLGHMSRLILPTALVQDHILRYLQEDDINSTKTGGLSVRVWDHDTGTSHELRLKRWPSSKSYVLIGGWRNDFVIRRLLKEKDEIGLFWNPFSSKFHFCVLSRAAAPPQNPN